MKPNNASEDIWLWVETGNEKFKEDSQTQHADGSQAMSVLYIAQLEAISKQLYFSWEGGGSLSPWPRHVSAEAQAMQHVSIINCYPSSLAPCEVFVIASHFNY